jgi:hypothetical protein
MRTLNSSCTATIIAGALLGLSQIVGAADPNYLRATAGFVSLESYPLAFDATWTAVLKTLSDNAIAITSSDMNSGIIHTGFIDGPTLTNTGKETHIRYQFDVSVSKGGPGQSSVTITPAVEASQLKILNKWIYQDVTARNAAIAADARNWLSEKIAAATGGSSSASVNTTSSTTASPTAALTTSVPPGWVDPIDVDSIKLGMTLKETRAILSAKGLFVHREFQPNLGYSDPVSQATVPIPNTTFTSGILAWKGSGRFDLQEDWELVYVMFTPDPGHERAAQIVRTVNYSLPHAVREVDLRKGLTDKYQNLWYAAGGGKSSILEWRFRAAQNLSRPLTCQATLQWDNHPFSPPSVSNLSTGLVYGYSQPTNPVLMYSSTGWRTGIGCETSEIRETHQVVNETVPPEQRIVTQFTVNALSFTIASEAARTLAQFQQAAASAAGKSIENNAKKQAAPIL